MNASDIKANPVALAAATANDWSACAVAMQAVSVTEEPRLCFSVETSMAIIAVGGDPNQIMTAMDKDATGKLLLAKLATVGVMWAHPLTSAYLDAAVAASGLGKASRDAAVNLSQPTTFPFASVTADQCRVAFETDALSSEWSAILNDGGVNVALSTGDRDGLDNSIILYVASHGIESLKSAMIAAHKSDYLSDETKAALAAAIEVL